MMMLKTCVAGLSLAMVSSVLAQSGTELLLKPMADSVRTDGVAAVTYFDRVETENDDQDFQLTRYFAEGRLRLVPGFEADPRVGFSYTHLNLNSDDPALPSHLTDASIGLGTGIARFDGWVAGLVVGGGHASANAFGDGNGTYGTATLLLGKTIDEYSSLGVAVDYNGNRSFMPDVPLPGVVYTRKIPDRKLEVSLGFPFAYGRWRPTEQLLLELNFTFPDFVGGRVSYELAEGLGVFASVASRTDSFHFNDLADPDDRLFFRQRLAEAGVRYEVRDTFVISLAGGWAFGQEFTSGWDTRDDDLVADIEDGPFARIEAQFSF
jgi:hypothetical protein